MLKLGLKSLIAYAPVLLLSVAPGAGFVWADCISPGISDDGAQYSSEPPNTAYFGTGAGSHLSEASSLRFAGEQDLDNGAYDAAVRKLAKAVQLDMGCPIGHVLYARALTRKLESSLGSIDPQLLANCIREWKLIWRHDADISEQAEARIQAKRLSKLQRMLEKQGKIASVKDRDQQLAIKEVQIKR